MSDPVQSLALQTALGTKVLRLEPLFDIDALVIFSELIGTMGRGEAACLALAQTRRWLLASDEKRALRREALARLGRGRLLNTPGILLLGIKAGVLGVEAADEAKRVLESHGFKMTFSSFADLLGRE